LISDYSILNRHTEYNQHWRVRFRRVKRSQSHVMTDLERFETISCGCLMAWLIAVKPALTLTKLHSTHIKVRTPLGMVIHHHPWTSIAVLLCDTWASRNIHRSLIKRLEGCHCVCSFACELFACF
jgi:hypothetical protein